MARSWASVEGAVRDTAVLDTRLVVSEIQGRTAIVEGVDGVVCIGNTDPS